MLYALFILLTIPVRAICLPVWWVLDRVWLYQYSDQRYPRPMTGSEWLMWVLDGSRR